MTDPVPPPTFGARPVGVPCEERPAAYAVIFDSFGRVAVVVAKDRWFLPGGGSLPGESAEATVLREIREECGRSARVTGRLGEAIQYFHDATRWYGMLAVFFRAEFVGGQTGSAEHELVWVDPGETGGFYHQCHVWAVARGRIPTRPRREQGQE
jgi:8-oxo-dGTP pyrophosphatase MutT (NUDIX family)